MANNNHFSLNLDTSINAGTVVANTYYTAPGNVTLSYAEDATQMKVWYSANSTESETPSGLAWEAVAATKQLSFAAEGRYYAHAQFKDGVGNVSPICDSAQFTYEVTGPAVSTVEINNGDATTNHRANNTITFSFTAPLSGINSGTVSGNIVGSPVALALTDAEISAGQATRTFTFTDAATEGTQTLTITLTSAAGLNGTGTDSITLDLTPATGSITLRNAADTANVTGPIKYTEIGARITCSANDWVSYTLSGDFTESPINKNVTATEKTAGFVFNAITLNTGDSVKTISGTITDAAGNVTTLDSVTIRLDQTAPLITASVDNVVISAQTGHNSATLTMSVVEAVEQAFWKIWLDDAESAPIDSGTGNLPATKPITNSTLSTEGAHVIHISVTDTAGNEGTQTVNINLDTTGPVIGEVSITNHNGYIGGNLVDTSEDFVRYGSIGVTASATDTPAGVAKGYCWLDNNASTATIPSGTTAKTSNFGTFSYGEINTTGKNESGTNYAHVAYEDNVGNVTYAHLATAVIIDTTVPGAGTITGLPAYCHKTQNTITITPDDTNIVSGKGWYKVWGDISSAATEQAAEWTAYNGGNITITLSGSTTSASKTIYVKWRDAAGNVQTASAASATTELDMDTPDATLAIYDADDLQNIANVRRPVNTFVAHISGTDDTGTGVAAAYLLYGNFTEADAASIAAFTAGNTYAANDLVSNTIDGQLVIRKVTTADTYATWDTLVAASTDPFQTLTYNAPATGTKTHYLTTVLNGTTGDGEKVIKLRVRDDAGNISPEVSASYIYDASAPVVNIDSHDRDIISKVHELIGTAGSGDAADKKGYADFVEFVFSVNEHCQHWKVCAYLNQSAAESGSANDPAIGNTNGSVNMTGTVIEANATVTAYLNGADYEAALGTAGTVDGAHFVVVYVQDDAGTWSEAANFVTE